MSDGITENLINSLSQLPQLKVIPRTTAFRYKGQQVDPQKVGRDLGVDAVLTGKVMQQGEDLIIQAELTNTADGSQLWGQRYKSEGGGHLLAAGRDRERNIREATIEIDGRTGKPHDQAIHRERRRLRVVPQGTLPP